MVLGVAMPDARWSGETRKNILQIKTLTTTCISDTSFTLRVIYVIVERPHSQTATARVRAEAAHTQHEAVQGGAGAIDCRPRTGPHRATHRSAFLLTL